MDPDRSLYPAVLCWTQSLKVEQGLSPQGWQKKKGYNELIKISDIIYERAHGLYFRTWAETELFSRA
jgi:hypothetical protein